MTTTQDLGTICEADGYSDVQKAAHQLPNFNTGYAAGKKTGMRKKT